MGSGGAAAPEADGARARSEAAAATRIQSVHRGKAARRQVAERRARHDLRAAGEADAAAAAGEAEERGAQEAATARLVAAVEAEDWEAVEGLLQDPAAPHDVNARTPDWGYALLRAAAEEGALASCRLLLDRGADPNSRDQNGMTPLMGCITGGDFGGLVQLLLDARADAAARTDDGFDALAWATRLGREQAIAALRASGASGAESCFK